MVRVVFTNYKGIHAVLVFVAGGCINAVCGDFKIHIVAAIGIIGKDPVFVPGRIQPFVVESVRAGDFYNAILAQWQLFGQGQNALAVGMKSVYIFCQMAVDSIGHCDELRVAVAVITVMPLLVQPVDLESGVGQQYRFAGFLVNFCDAKINFDFLVQYRKFLITVRACHYAVLGGSHSAPRIIVLFGVNAHEERLSLEQVMRHSGFDYEICTIGQALHTDIPGVIAEDFGKLVFIGAAGGLPAVALAVLVLTCRRQSFVVRGNFVGVDFIGLCDGLRFRRKIPLRMLVIVGLINVGIQNALQGVAAAAGLLKLFCFGQVGHKEECKARALQFQSVALAAGGYDFTDFHIAFGNLVLALGQCIVSMDVVIGAVAGLIDLFTGCLSIVGKGGLFYIPTLIRIGRRDVVVMLIAEVAVCKGQVIGIVGPRAIQRFTFRDCRKLVLVHPIRVLAAAVLGKRGGPPGGCLGAAVHGGIGAGNSKSAVTQRDNHAGGAFYDIIFAEVQIAEAQPAVLNFGAGNKMVFLQHRQIVRYPLPAVVADCGMPDGIAVRIHNFGVVHHAGHAIGVRNIFGGVKVVHRAVQRGIAVGLPAGKSCAVGGAAAHIPHGIKVNLGDADFAQGAVIFHNAVCWRDCVAVLIGRLAAIVGVISTTGILGSVVNGNGGFYACTGDKFGAAFVGSGNVGIIVSIVQPDYRIVLILGDFDIVTALAQRSVGHAGMIDVCPIAKIACGRFGFHDDKLARITLCVVEGVAHRIRGRIGRTVDDRISAIALALHTVSVVTAGGLVFACYSIPLENLILRVGSNLIAGFAVGFLEVDLQGPFIVFHQIGIV